MENVEKRSKRVVTVTPAGRKRYLQILANYLLRNRHIIHHHVWWMNTRDQDDVAYLFKLVDQYPDFFRIAHQPMIGAEPVGHSIWRFMRECTDPDTIYIRLDDDICYIGEGALEAMSNMRLADPAPFLILGNIANNAICTYWYQQSGLLPKTWEQTQELCMDETGWRSGPFAIRLHRWFQNEIANNRLHKLREVPFGFNGRERFSINAICWTGSDMALIDDRYRSDIDEEPFLTADIPQRLNRPNRVCSAALFSHFAFYIHRKQIESLGPEILLRYQRMSDMADPMAAHRIPLLDRLRLLGIRTQGWSAYSIRMGVRKLKAVRPRHWKSLLTRLEASARKLWNNSTHPLPSETITTSPSNPST